jgi:hypothetical protein
MWLQILSAEHVVNPVFATVCTATDLLIASSMCYLLVRNRSEFARYRPVTFYWYMNSSFL